MTAERHVRGKHYEQITGRWWVVWIYLVTGLVVGSLKIKRTYRGVKGG